MLGFSSFYGAFILQQRKIYYIIQSVIIMKKIAVINDLSGFGKCSLTAAIPVISAHGVQCCPLTTGIFSNQTGFDSYKYLDCTDIMQDFINEWKSLDVKFDGILSGFIANSKQGSIISDFIDDFKTPETLVVVDPVMADDGILYDCYDDNSVSQIIALTEKADIITPNLTELCIICDENYNETIKLPKEKLLDKIKGVCSLPKHGLHTLFRFVRLCFLRSISIQYLLNAAQSPFRTDMCQPRRRALPCP